MLGFVEGEVPGVAVDEIPAGAWRVRLEAAGAEQDADAFGAEGFDAAAEGRAAGQRGVDEGQDHDRDVEAGGLGEHAEGVGVADAQGPFVDRVVGGRGDDDGVGYLGAGRAGRAVLAADGVAGGFLDGGRVEEIEGGGGGDDLDTSSRVRGRAGRRCRWRWPGLRRTR